MKKIILFGGGGHANSCIDVINLSKKFKVQGVVLKNKNSKNKTNYPTVQTSENFKKIVKISKNALIAIGMFRDHGVRLNIFKKAKKAGFNFPVIISPKSYVSKKSTIGDGTIIMHGAFVNINSNIGFNSIVNSHSIIEHDVIIGNNCHLAPGSIINGDVKIGDNTFIGSGSIIKNGIKIGNKCIIQAGSFVNKNLPNNSLFKNKNA